MSGTSTFSMISSPVSELRIPSLPWMARWLKPGMPCSRMKAVTPFWRFSGSLRARTTNTWPTVPWVMNILVPLSTQWSPLRTAVDFIPAASEPLPGSVRPQAPSHSPLASFGRYRRCWASLPKTRMWLVPSPLWLATVSASEPSYRAISSTATATARLSMRRAAVLLGDEHAQHAQLAERLHHLGGEALVVVPVTGVRLDPLLAEVAERGLKGAVALGKGQLHRSVTP